MRVCIPLLATLGCLLPADASPQRPGATDAAPTTKTADLMQLIRRLAIGSTNADATRKQIQVARKDPKLASLPPAYWNDLEQVATPEVFERLMLPILDKAYTHEEVRQLLKLMTTPEFRLFMDKNPLQKVVREGYPVFSKYMDEQAKQLREKHQPTPQGAPEKK